MGIKLKPSFSEPSESLIGYQKFNSQTISFKQDKLEFCLREINRIKLKKESGDELEYFMDTSIYNIYNVNKDSYIDNNAFINSREYKKIKYEVEIAQYGSQK